MTDHLDTSLADLPEVVVPVLRRVYDLNAGRHDPLVGDDAVTFAISIYRHSWFLLEEEFNQLLGWRTARPKGSLVITFGGFRIHVYRHGRDELVDLDTFRLAEAQASATKRAIAAANSDQLTLFDAARYETDEPAATIDLPNLVVVHAGNPDDGCCGVWVGAPVATEEATTSPWAWIEELWRIERVQAVDNRSIPGDVTRYDELSEPDLDIELADDDESASGEQ